MDICQEVEERQDGHQTDIYFSTCPNILREVRGREGGGAAIAPRVVFDDACRLFLVLYERI